MSTSSQNHPDVGQVEASPVVLNTPHEQQPAPAVEHSLPHIVITDGTELVSRRPLTGAEAAVVVCFLVVGAALLVVGKPITVILGLFAGVGGVAVAVLARRIPKITWR